jgi:hypothetical protein
MKHENKIDCKEKIIYQSYKGEFDLNALVSTVQELNNIILIPFEFTTRRNLGFRFEDFLFMNFKVHCLRPTGTFPLPALLV